MQPGFYFFPSGQAYNPDTSFSTLLASLPLTALAPGWNNTFSPFLVLLQNLVNRNVMELSALPCFFGFFLFIFS